ncbi:hypothetical protein CMI38_06845 [Candidatus Pacearchaeota archaeon]|jgi:hypothetical protein|nr:hypothetical protein [Candidatus Pacearchaeota archaeon]|tara:strand:- start:86 stop:577 length:492 start_codon:yes stop_codon:yes gene_type:complete
MGDLLDQIISQPDILYGAIAGAVTGLAVGSLATYAICRAYFNTDPEVLAFKAEEKERLIDKLAPPLEKYLTTKDQDPDKEKRDACRAELIDEIKSDFRDHKNLWELTYSEGNKDFKHKLTGTSYLDNKALRMINDIAEAKYPLPEQNGHIPRDLKRLADAVLK